MNTLLFLFFLFLGLGCGTLSRLPAIPEGPSCGRHSFEKKGLWQAPGAIQFVRVAPGGEWGVISIVPDADLPARDGLRKPRLIALSQTGQVLWSQVLSSPVKGMDLSTDGQRLAYTDFLGQLTILDPSGKELWKAPGAYCRPFFPPLEPHAVWCDQDDDADSQWALQGWTRDGKKDFELSVPPAQESLVLQVAPSGKSLAIGLLRGELWWLESPRSQKPRLLSVPGEILQLAWGRAGLWVSYRQGGVSGPPRLAWFAEPLSLARGPSREWALPFAAVQLVALKEGVFFSQDSNQGQWLGRLASSQAGEEPKIVWQSRLEPEFIQPLRVFEGTVYRGVEHPFLKEGLAQLQEWSETARDPEVLCLASQSGAYLSDFFRRGPVLWVATDDGILHFWERLAGPSRGLSNGPMKKALSPSDEL